MVKNIIYSDVHACNIYTDVQMSLSKMNRQCRCLVKSSHSNPNYTTIQPILYTDNPNYTRNASGKWLQIIYHWNRTIMENLFFEIFMQISTVRGIADVDQTLPTVTLIKNPMAQIHSFKRFVVLISAKCKPYTQATRNRSKLVIFTWTSILDNMIQAL